MPELRLFGVLAVVSDTPRTAAIARKWSLKGGGTNTSDASPEAKELYEHAFALEREVAALREALETCLAAIRLEHAFNPTYGWGRLATDIEEQIKKGKP